MRHRTALALLLVALAFPACAPSEAPAPSDPPEAGWQGSIEQRDGVVRVRNPEEGLWDHADTTPIRFEPDGAFGGAGTQISSIAGAVVDRDANVHIFDALGGELVKLATDGSVVHRVGRDGPGEEEFQDVRGIAYDGDETIWVVNQGGTRLDAWGIDGQHRRAIPVEELGLTRVFMGGVLAADRLALIPEAVHNMAVNEYVVVNPSAGAEVVDSFSIGAEPMVPIPPGVVLQLSHHFHDGKIYVGTWEQYVLRVYDADGTLLRRVTRPVDYLRRPGFALLDEQYLGVALGGLAAPIVLDGGYWLVLATWPTNVDNANAYAEMPVGERPPIEWASSLDLFDPDGRFLYSVPYPGAQAPDIGRPWAVGPAGLLYTVTATPFPQVRRYRVVLEPPATH